MLKKFILFPPFLISSLSSSIIQKEGSGFPENRHSGLILHVNGTLYEMGYQHGILLKPMIEKIVSAFIDSPKNELTSFRFTAIEKALLFHTFFHPPRLPVGNAGSFGRIRDSFAQNSPTQPLSGGDNDLCMS